jgi:hypothetical protein
VKYIVQCNWSDTVVTLDIEMNVARGNSVELAFRCIHFDRFAERLVVAHDVSMGREVLRGTGIENPEFGLLIVAVTINAGFACRRGCLEGNSSPGAKSSFRWGYLSQHVDSTWPFVLQCVQSSDGLVWHTAGWSLEKVISLLEVGGGYLLTPSRLRLPSRYRNPEHS